MMVQKFDQEVYMKIFGSWFSQLFGFVLKECEEGKKTGPEILEAVKEHIAEDAKTQAPKLLKMLGIDKEDIEKDPYESYVKVFDHMDRTIGCETLEWIKESNDSWVEIAGKCWLYEGAKRYPQLATVIIEPQSRAFREQYWSNLELEPVEMVPKLPGVPTAEHCKVRVRVKKE